MMKTSKRKELLDLSMEELVARSQEDCHDSLSILIYKSRPAIFHAISQFGPKMKFGISDKDDIYQIICLRLHQKIKQLREIKFFKIWLRTVINNIILDLIRHKKDPCLSLDYEYEGEFSDYSLQMPCRTNLEQEFIHKENFTKIVNAIHNLPKTFKETAVLALLHNESYEDISTKLNIKMGTVKSKVFRSRERILKDIS